MTLVRIHRHQGGFVTIANSTMRDERLSFRARGLLAYLLSHEDGFVTSIKQIIESSREGREAIAAALREIEAAGYLDRPRQQDEKGRWHTYWDLHEVPPEADSQPSVDPEPIPGNPAFGASGTKEKTNEKKKTTSSADQGVRPRNPLWDSVVEACGLETNLTGSAASMVGKAVKELSLVGAKPEEVLLRAERYRKRYRDCELTPPALIKHWNSLNGHRARPPKPVDYAEWNDDLQRWEYEF